MRIDEGLDTGPILLAERRMIAPEETAADLYESLAEVGARLMVKTLHGLAEGTITPVAQDDAKATLAPILTREDGAIDFARGARNIHDRWRGFQPWPGAWTMLRGKKLTVHRMRVGAEPGITAGMVEMRGEAMVVGCGDGEAVVFDEVQMEGKRRMGAGEFLRGFQVRQGERVGVPL
jgi:methionyl-tRNA formyltransferase